MRDVLTGVELQFEDESQQQRWRQEIIRVADHDLGGGSV